MDEVKTEEIPTKNKVRFSEVAKRVLESNKEEKKFDLENDIKVIEAKEKVKTKRQEIKEELEKKYKTELKDAQIKRQSVWLVIAIFCIVMLLFLGTIFQLKKTKQKNQVLKEAFEKQLILEKELTGVRDHIVRFSR